MPYYRKKALQEMYPWTPTTVMSRVSVSQADKDNGSPKLGDMIAVNPNDSGGMRLIAAQWFKDNYVQEAVPVLVLRDE